MNRGIELFLLATCYYKKLSFDDLHLALTSSCYPEDNSSKPIGETREGQDYFRREFMNDEDLYWLLLAIKHQGDVQDYIIEPESPLSFDYEEFATIAACSKEEAVVALNSISYFFLGDDHIDWEEEIFDIAPIIIELIEDRETFDRIDYDKLHELLNDREACWMIVQREDTVTLGELILRSRAKSALF